MKRLARLVAGCLVGLVVALGSRPAAAQSSVDLRRLRVTDAGVVAAMGPGRAPAKLTLDPRWQRAAARLLARSGAPEGAIVASDVRTGRILVWASRGGRDFVAQPLAPTASLFKIVTAAALLERGDVTSGTRECYGGGGEHGITRRDLEVRGSVCTTVGEALGRSVNLVFARLAARHLAADDLRRMAEGLGFSGVVPIDVRVGAGSVEIPEDRFGMARAAAGFGGGRVSPLGALFAMQTIANEGERVRLSILDGGGATRPVGAGRALPAGTARSLARMLEGTTTRGTCARAFRRADGSRALASTRVAAKTGTLVRGSPARMYSWFAAFAPADAPEVAVAVMLGNDLTWRTKANLVGRELLEAWFEPSAPERRAAHAPGPRRRR